ncbi:aminoglycoside phosphotransferase (APT) family kinase protein [Actinokineospora baliensis]|nr:aminoglycoside phosphotransferase (APT) family kinase protein [Actinokineospora baliensis]
MREIALAPHLPAGLTAPLLASGIQELATREVRFACYDRVPGTPPGMGLPDVDEPTARRLVQQAVDRLLTLHGWEPADAARAVLLDVDDDGGFTGRDTLVARIEKLKAHELPRPVLDGLAAIAERAPEHSPRTTPLHADCHWSNWLAHNGDITALLDFEWARLGDPLDDWFFLIRFSGPHLTLALTTVSQATGIPADDLRTHCETREAAYLTADVLTALENSGPQAAAGRIQDLETLTVQRLWHT